MFFKPFDEISADDICSVVKPVDHEDNTTFDTLTAGLIYTIFFSPPLLRSRIVFTMNPSPEK